MKLLKKSKKGFTIVELVIVVAVIAVLAAVLIPTFINLTSKANKASDESLVTSLNKALAIEEVDNKPQNMHDAVEGLKREGYLASALVTKSDQKLLYNLEENRFLLEENRNDSKYENIPDYKFWTIQESYDSSKQQYSIYAADNFSTEEIEDLKVGFDAGDSENISSISYVGNGESAQNVIIRSNGGSIEVNAPTDKVYHYGKVDALEVKSVAPTSYHEKGEVGYAKLFNGRFVVEEVAKIDGLFLVANNSGEFDDIKIAVVGKAKLPELARADVTLNDGESKLVVEVQTLANSEAVDENPEYVWISKSGSEVTAIVSSSNNASDYSSHVVENPTPAAAATKEKAKDSANPVSEASLFRINAVGYETLEAAVVAARAGDTLVLLKDITYGEDRSVPVWQEKPFSIDLNGNTFTTNSSVGQTLSNNGYTASAFCFAIGEGTINVTNGAIKTAYGAGIYLSGQDLYIKDVEINQNYPENVQTTNEYSSAVRITYEGVVTIDSGSFRGKYALAVSNSGGTAIINGGTFHSDLFFSANTNSGVTKLITINGGTFTDFNVVNADKGTLVINGGTFSSTHYTLEQFSAFVASGKTVVTNSDGSWTVK